MLRVSMLLAGFSLGLLSSASAQVSGPNEAVHFAVAKHIFVEHYHEKLRALRERGLALRAADGGTLTSEHRAALQADIDRVRKNYLREVAYSDAQSVRTGARTASQ